MSGDFVHATLSPPKVDIGPPSGHPLPINFCNFSTAMSSLRLGLRVFFPSILFASSISRAPFKMDSAAPSTQWADRPMKLITTPQYQTKKASSRWISCVSPLTDR
jgi:hypothetical protein